jgi:hypothetical protein
MREEGIVLENQSETAPVNRDGGKVHPIPANLALLGSFQPGNNPQQRGFTAAGRSEQAHGLARLNSEGDAAEERLAFVRFMDVNQFKHGTPKEKQKAKKQNGFAIRFLFYLEFTCAR